jgi:hypothetical protein
MAIHMDASLNQCMASDANCISGLPILGEMSTTLSPIS